MIQVLVRGAHEPVALPRRVIADLSMPAAKGRLGKMCAKLIDVTLNRLRRDAIGISELLLREQLAPAQPIVHVQQARAFVFVFVHRDSFENGRLSFGGFSRGRCGAKIQ